MSDKIIPTEAEIEVAKRFFDSRIYREIKLPDIVCVFEYKLGGTFYTSYGDDQDGRDRLWKFNDLVLLMQDFLTAKSQLSALEKQNEEMRGKSEAFDYLKAKTESFNPNQRVTITFRPHGSLKSLIEYETFRKNHITHLEWDSKAYGGGDTLEQAILALKSKLPS